MLNSEKEVLEEAAASATTKVQESREAMAAQTKQLGQLQYLPPRLQDMQEQVRTLFYSLRTHGCMYRFCLLVVTVAILVYFCSYGKDFLYLRETEQAWQGSLSVCLCCIELSVGLQKHTSSAGKRPICISTYLIHTDADRERH